MSPIDIRDATIRFYEDYALTEGYDEAQSTIIQQWGEAQLQLMANTASDESDFETRYDAMRGVLKMINRYIMQRETLDDEKNRNYIRVLIERAQQAGYPPKLTSVADVVNNVANLDDANTIRALLALVETGAAVTSSPLPGSAPTPLNQQGFLSKIQAQAASVVESAQEVLGDATPHVNADAEAEDEQAHIDSDTVLFPKEELDALDAASVVDDGLDAVTVLFPEEELDAIAAHDKPAKESTHDEETTEDNTPQQGSRWRLSDLFKRSSSIDDVPGSDRK